MTPLEASEPTLEPIYVASRASIPERGVMWRRFRSEGIPITSSWIDEDGEGETASFVDLWDRIHKEIAAASALLLYAERDDFPLKGALIEAGIALGMGKPVIVCLPDLGALPRNYRPVGSWIAHPLVSRRNNIQEAVNLATRVRVPANGVPTVDTVDRAIVLRELMRISCASSYCVCVPMAVEKIRALAAASPVAPDNYIEIQCAGCGRSTDVGLLLCPSCVDRGHSPEGES